jgi:inner membrane transporter RhtA
MNGEKASASLVERVPPQLWFMGSAVFHYLGPSFAVLLFARVPVGGVAWLRIVSAAVLFAAWRRPWRSFFRADGATQRLTISLGLIFAVMNYTFYMAISRLPLGTVAAIEFVGPIVLALTGSRTRRNLLALALAVAGVYLLTEVHVGGDPGAFGWAFANAGLFAVYIVLAHAVARADPAISPLDRLAAAMMIAGVAITPLGIIEGTTVLTDPVAWAAGIGVGISSSIFPYVFDQMAMQRLSRATYSLFVALLPATAVVIAMIVLTQIPQLVEIGAVGLVVAAVLIHQEGATAPDGTRTTRSVRTRDPKIAQRHVRGQLRAARSSWRSPPSIRVPRPRNPRGR